MDLAREQVADPESSVGLLEETRFVGSPPMDAASIQLLPMVSAVVPKSVDPLQEDAAVRLSIEMLEASKFKGFHQAFVSNPELLPMVSVVVPKFGDLLQEVATVDPRLILATSFLDFVQQWVAL